MNSFINGNNVWSYDVNSILEILLKILTMTNNVDAKIQSHTCSQID